VTADIAQEAARVRAATSWKLPDAVAVATAIVGGADAFLTNDRQLTRGETGLDILILDDLLDV
jgi:predicted nucleic acid-binding protein